MKKYIIVMIGALLGVCAQAKPIEKTKAAAIAARYFAKASHKKKELKLVEGNGMRKVKAANDADAKAFYAFNATDGEGFVIVSGDDQLTEIVGYGDKGNIGAKTYNILGQPVNDGYHGIVIRNGRKMMR